MHALNPNADVKVAANESLIRELAFTGRDFGAEEALSLGLVSRSVTGSRREALASALELASAIARLSPVAVAGTKACLLQARDTGSVAEGLLFVAAWNGAALQAQDLPTAALAHLAKEIPVFSKL